MQRSRIRRQGPEEVCKLVVIALPELEDIGRPKAWFPGPPPPAVVGCGFDTTSFLAYL